MPPSSLSRFIQHESAERIGFFRRSRPRVKVEIAGGHRFGEQSGRNPVGRNSGGVMWIEWNGQRALGRDEETPVGGEWDQEQID